MTDMESLKKMAQDIARSSQDIGPKQARFLCDQYYSIQEWRLAMTNRSKALAKSEQPKEVVQYASEQLELLEKQLARALGYYVESEKFGIWLTSIVGIGPVIASGLMSNVDWPNTNVATKLWSYSGLNPQAKWEKGKPRPWNAFLKTLSFKIGESFIKFQRHENDFYGKWYAWRKAIEWQRNLDGTFSPQAVSKMQTFPVDPSTNAYQWYVGNIDPKWAMEIVAQQKLFPLSIPKSAFLPDDAPRFHMLPPGHIHARARRYAVKLFLSHCVEVAHWLNHGVLAPTIYIIAKESHADYIYPHNSEVVDEMAPGFTEALQKRYGPRYSRIQKPSKNKMYFGEDSETTGELVTL